MGIETFRITVEAENAQKRIDVYLADLRPAIASRSRIKKAIERGDILVNNAVVKPNHLIREGELISVIMKPEPIDATLKPEEIALDILYEDEYLVVVNKPAGMAAHPSAGIASGTLVNALLFHCCSLSGSDEGRPGIVHRLDKNTSGLMVAAKDDRTHGFLAAQFKDRTISKIYVAIVKGDVKRNEGIIKASIGRHPYLRQKQAVRPDHARDALTRYKVIKRFRYATLVELYPKTGRMHQLRVHLAYIKHPIVGDETYGGKSDLIGRQALHARTLGFIHPVSGEHLEFEAPLPPDMSSLLEKLSKEKSA
ncbi:MAG: RluA family pseudouridine synthase [Candidatus Omnitrophota bacterium]